ncbi:MAG: carboxypeptidase regulatory-like domain-containing protein [Acidobacteriota bacterium]
MRNEGSFRSWCLGLLYLSCVSSLLSAQVEVGSLFGAVEDTEGIALPGVNLSLTGYGELKVQTSDALGQFRFLGLEPGVWSLTAKLDGFSTVDYPTINIEASRSTSIVIELSAAIEEAITVVAESPLLDERKIATGTTLRRAELEKLPMARDPWAAATQSPGVVLNRIDVGGASSANQANLSGIAVGFRQNDYVLDGAQVGDSGGAGLFLGGTPLYFDFDQLEELQILTGGNDVTKNTPGIAVNLVTKRGSNEMRGSGRFLLTEGDGYFGVLEQAEPGFDPDELGPGQEDFVGDEIDRLTEYGFEAGGPAWRDHLWLWGAWSQRDFNTRSGRADPFLTVLENAAIKVNAQLSPANSLVASYNNGLKLSLGRFAGLGVDRSATQDQRSPTGITKVEDSHVFGSNLFLTATYNYVDSGFDLTAVGGSGPDRPPIPDPGGEANADATGYLTNNGSRRDSRPQEQVKVDASYFVNTGAVAHELRFGGRLRQSNISSIFSYPGRNIYHYHGQLAGVQDPDLLAQFGLPPERYMDAHVVYAFRSGEAPTEVDTRTVWVQDTLTWSRWTVNAGLRYEFQDGANLPDTVEANLGFPEVMPAIEYPGDDAGGFTWRTIAPRLGVTYALGEERQTLLRASLSQFPASLSNNQIDRTNPVAGQFAAMLFLDDPGGFSGFYDDGEPYRVIGGLFGFDPTNPTALSTSNRTDPALDPELLTELVVGAEHAFLPEFVVGASLTWRRNDRIHDRQPLFEDSANGEIRTANADEYLFGDTVSGNLPDGTPYEWDTFALPDNLRSTSGSFLTNGDRRADAMSAALTLTKRLSNRWMARGFINYIFKEEWSVPASYFDHNDPNRTGADVIDGGPFGGPLGGLNSRWQWNLNGMYQVAPERAWGFNVAANLTGRQGFQQTYTRTVRGEDGIRRTIMVVDSVDDYRLEDIFVADLRLEKEFAASGSTSLTFSIDAFNIFNQGYVLDRVPNLDSRFPDWVLGTLSPRVYRLGVRLNWR